jgi:type I restriction enzyme S subunit
MGEWQTLPLGEALTFQRGFDITKDEQRDGPYPVISSSGPKTTHAKYKVRGPGVVIGRKGSLGTVFYSESDYWPHDTTLWVKDFHGNHPRFAYYFLQTMGFERLDAGASNPSLNRNHIHTIPVRWPPLPVQRRIARILSAYDDLIENNQRRIKILEEMARSLYREWFVRYRSPGHDKVKMVPSSVGPIPQGWEVKPLGELATVTMGLSPRGDTYNEEEDGTPLVNGPVEFGDRFTKRVKWTTEPTKLCKEGDLVVCVRGSTTGKYVKSDGVYCLGRGVCGISSKYQCFIDLLFENELPILLGQTSGSTFPSWTGPQLKSYPVLSPPPEVLARFDRLIQPMSAAVLRYSRQIQNLGRTRDLLLPRLLAGQIDLKSTDATA